MLKPRPSMRSLVVMLLMIGCTTPLFAQGAAPPAAEAEELDAGTDPSKSTRRVNLYDEFDRVQNGASLNKTTVQVMLPILGGGGSLSASIPFSYSEIPQGRPFGLGDVSFRVILLPTHWSSMKGRWSHPRITPFIGVESFIPSADTTLSVDANHLTTLTLGTAKFRERIMTGVAWALSKEWLILPLYQQEFSVAGDPAFSDINQGTVRLFVQYQHRSGLYVKPELQWVINFIDDNRLDFYIAPEVGQVFGGGTVAYFKPGVGVIDDPSNRDWGIEFGIRQKF